MMLTNKQKVGICKEVSKISLEWINMDAVDKAISLTEKAVIEEVLKEIESISHKDRKFSKFGSASASVFHSYVINLLKSKIKNGGIEDENNRTTKYKSR